MQDRVRSAGRWGFIGVILQLVGLLLGGLAALAGYVVELVALKRLAEAFNNRAIWSNALKTVILVATAALALLIVTPVVFSGVPVMLGPSLKNSSPLLLLLGWAVAVYILLYVFVLLVGRYFRNIYTELAKSSGVSEFREAAKWTWLGALLTIVLIGVVLSLVGKVYALLGYDSLRKWKPQQLT